MALAEMLCLGRHLLRRVYPPLPMFYLYLPLRTPSLGLAPQTCYRGSFISFMNLSRTSMLTCLLYHVASDHPIGRHGEPIIIDGHSLSIPALVAVARHNTQIVLDDSPETRTGIQKSRDVIVGKVEASQSVYGVSTGFGGSGKSFPPVSSLRLVTHQRVRLKPILVRPTLWLSEVHYCSTNTRAFCPHPQMSFLLFLFLIHSRLRACQSLGFAERFSSASTP